MHHTRETSRTVSRGSLIAFEASPETVTPQSLFSTQAWYSLCRRTWREGVQRYGHRTGRKAEDDRLNVCRPKHLAILVPPYFDVHWSCSLKILVLGLSHWIHRPGWLLSNTDKPSYRKRMDSRSRKRTHSARNWSNTAIIYCWAETFYSNSGAKHAW